MAVEALGSISTSLPSEGHVPTYVRFSDERGGPYPFLFAKGVSCTFLKQGDHLVFVRKAPPRSGIGTVTRLVRP